MDRSSQGSHRRIRDGIHDDRQWVHAKKEVPSAVFIVSESDIGWRRTDIGSGIVFERREGWLVRNPEIGQDQDAASLLRV